MTKIFFDSWESLVRTFVITVLAYCLLIFLLRTFGKRTLTKMNAFDLVVSVALGSTLASVMVSKDVALLDGALAFFLLILLQYIISWASLRNATFNNIVKSTPSLLVYKGAFLKQAMSKDRIKEEEIYSVVRQNGLSEMDEVEAIILETDGTLSLIRSAADLNSQVMKKVIVPQHLKNDSR
jgi:uncharacterized membrane protein YcaP (DUF421 family)